MTNYSVFDVETDGLLEEATKIHCLCVTRFIGGKAGSFSITDYDEMRKFFAEERVFIGHNIIRFDIPVCEKLLGITVRGKLIDTLGISWYLYPLRKKHGLEEWGEFFNVPKPIIGDWKNLTIEEYVHRCQEDVKINTLLFNMQVDYLNVIYRDAGIDRIMGYIGYKLKCAKEQEEIKWKLDIERCKANLAKLLAEREIKVKALIEVMPEKITFKYQNRPKELYKKDGSFSIAGQRWSDLTTSRKLPLEHTEPIVVGSIREAGKPSSPEQVKSWLFGLGWKPRTFKYVKEGDTNRAVPQVTLIDEPDLCESVKELYEVEPGLEHLGSLGIISHRIGILEGFLESMDKNGFLKAEIAGFTNTMRFKHKKPLVNLPTIPKPYWEEVRGCLIAPSDNHLLCGSDMSGLEDNTKRHYMFKYDPEYVKEMMSPDFDPHLDIAVIAQMLTLEEANEHKLYEKTKEDAVPQGKSHKAVRGKAKKVNFSGVYGAGPPKIALTGGFPLEQAKTMHTAYWKRNWSVKAIAKDCLVRTIGNQMWLYNPVSQFWYSLRYDKDRFSTLNQGTGVYCFDTWVSNVRKRKIRVCGQFHDEIITPLLKGDEENLKAILLSAIDETNDELKLNVQLRISIDFGHSYADIH